jgi:hypothetical protein
LGSTLSTKVMHHKYLTHLQSFLHDTVGTVGTVNRYDLKITTAIIV